MTRKKGVVTAVIAALAVCILISGILVFNKTRKKSIEELPIDYMYADLAYDPSDLRTLVGLVDYVFIGTVIDQDEETIYDNYSEHNGKVFADPFTGYTVQVTENIKGNLRTDEPIYILKDGGIELDGKSVLLYSGDSFPQVGCTYIFSGIAQHWNGGIMLSGPGTNVLLEAAADSNTAADASATDSAVSYSAESLSKIDEFLAAYDDEIVFNRDRAVSVYEVSDEVQVETPGETQDEAPGEIPDNTQDEASSELPGESQEETPNEPPVETQEEIQDDTQDEAPGEIQTEARP
ncbi:MAG: hypothetical protein ACI3VB_09475 [Oscillospiraceae bacterium]